MLSVKNGIAATKQMAPIITTRDRGAACADRGADVTHARPACGDDVRCCGHARARSARTVPPSRPWGMTMRMTMISM